MTTSVRGQGRGLPWLGIFHLLVLYVVWSTTYLAIKVAVEPGSGFPPWSMAGSRLVCAGLMLLVIAKVRRHSLRLTRRDVAILAATGLLLWIGGNGMVTWSEQYADSSYAALLVGAMPIWGAVMEGVLDRRRPSFALAAALLVGFAGVAVLTVPKLITSHGADLVAVVALLFAPLLWGSGALLQSRRSVSVSSLVSAGWQQVFGGLMFVVLSLAAREPLPHPTPTALAGWAYLVVVGGLAFFSFVLALQLLPARLVFTYAYVNPVGAALLGWWLLGEPITWWTVLGAALVILGVAGVFRERYRARKANGAADVDVVVATEPIPVSMPLTSTAEALADLGGVAGGTGIEPATSGVGDQRSAN